MIEINDLKKKINNKIENELIKMVSEKYNINNGELLDIWDNLVSKVEIKTDYSYYKEYQIMKGEKYNNDIRQSWIELPDDKRLLFKRKIFDRIYNKVCPVLMLSRYDYFDKKSEKKVKRLVLSVMEDNNVDIDTSEWSKHDFINYLCDNT